MNWFFHKKGGLGALALKGSTGTYHPQDPLFRPFLVLETHYFKPLSSSWDPTSIFWKKKCIFKPNFCRSWLLRHTFCKNLFPIPWFQAKKSVLETILLKTCAAHTYQFFLSTPKNGDLLNWTLWNFQLFRPNWKTAFPFNLESRKLTRASIGGALWTAEEMQKGGLHSCTYIFHLPMSVPPPS